MTAMPCSEVIAVGFDVPFPTTRCAAGLWITLERTRSPPPVSAFVSDDADTVGYDARGAVAWLLLGARPSTSFGMPREKNSVPSERSTRARNETRSDSI